MKRGCLFRLFVLCLKLSIPLLLLATVLPVLILRWVPPPTTAFMVENRLAAWRKGAKNFELHYRWIGWEDQSRQAAIAVVAAEDQKFPEHTGFDVESIEQALKEHETGQRKQMRGASTISQQVAKNLFLWSGRSFVRKGLEAYFTVLIELMWPKRRVLEVYLNIVELGPGIYGVSSASEIYFKKRPSQLTAEEAALLAAVLPNPRYFHVERPSSYVEERREWILSQMRMLGGTSYLQKL
jgi:monofunctional glycosyltransferase